MDDLHTGTPAHGLALTRLNHDSSWLVELDGTRIVLDPWLEGPAVVVLPPIHTATLGRPTCAFDRLGRVDALLLSHPFADHCNPTTLRGLPADLPLYAPPVAAWLGRRHRSFREAHVLGDATRGAGPTRIGRVDVSWCRAPARLDTTHNALVLRGVDSGASLVYAPHAWAVDSPVTGAVERALGGRRPDALLASFTLLDLPWYLGGIANLGPEAALALAERLGPRFVVPTHDGSKVDSGFIARVQRLVPCDDVPGLLRARGLPTDTLPDDVGRRWAIA